MTRTEQVYEVGNRLAAARAASDAKTHAREVREMLSEDENLEKGTEDQEPETVGGFLKEQAMRKKIQAKVQASKRRREEDTRNDETEIDGEELVSKKEAKRR